MDSDAVALKKIFIEAVINRGKELAEKRKEVQDNSKLSDSGKADEIAMINAEAREAMDALAKRYKAEHGKAREAYLRTLKGPSKPRTNIDRLMAKVNKAPDSEFVYLDDDQRALALVESNQAVIAALKKSSFMGVASRMSPEEISAAMARAFELDDLSSLENLAEIAAIRGDEGGISKGKAYVAELKEQSMAPAQKIAKLEIERLDIHEAIFESATQKALDGKGLDLLEAMALPGESDQRIDMQIASVKASTVNKE